MRRWVYVLGFWALFSCRPQIGDPCFNITDCFFEPQVGGLCDTTSPDGYCTIRNCLADTCPEEAFCVSFRDGDFTFCMAACLTAEDCREGYDCLPEAPEEGILFLDTIPREDGATGYCGVP